MLDSDVHVMRLSPYTGPSDPGHTVITITGTNFVKTANIMVKFTFPTTVMQTLLTPGTFLSTSTIRVESPPILSAVAATVEVGLNAQQFTNDHVLFYYYPGISDIDYVLVSYSLQGL